MTAPVTVIHVDTEPGWRGGQRQVLWLAQSLDSRRFRSLVAARPGEPLAERAAEIGLDVALIRPTIEIDPFAAWTLRRTIRRQHADIVHAHTGHALGLAALAIAGTTTRLIVTRRVDFLLRGNFGTRRKYNRADAIIAISRAVANGLAASGIPRRRIDIVPSGVDLSRRMAPASPVDLAALGIPAGAPLVVQVAQLVPHKDPLTFVEAIAVARQRVPALHALLVGDGPLHDAVVAAVARHGLEDVIHVLGYRQDADALLAAADVVTLSSREEGLGTVLLDALSCGKAVVATAAGGIPEMIENNISGMLAPVGDPTELGARIAALLADPDRRAAFASAARDRAAQFSIARTAERTAAVYERVLATPHR